MDVETQCKNCKYCYPLRFFKSSLHKIGGHGVISGVEIRRSATTTDEPLCCTAQARLGKDMDIVVYETLANDICELFSPKDEKHMTKIDFVIKKRARLEIEVTDEELEIIKAGGKLPDRIQNEVDAIDWKKNTDQNYSAWDEKVNLVGYTDLE